MHSKTKIKNHHPKTLLLHRSMLLRFKIVSEHQGFTWLPEHVKRWKASQRRSCWWRKAPSYMPLKTSLSALVAQTYICYPPIEKYLSVCAPYGFLGPPSRTTGWQGSVLQIQSHHSCRGAIGKAGKEDSTHRQLNPAETWDYAHHPASRL